MKTINCKLNKKGFTLIELLSMILVLGLIVGLSTYGIINAINNSKEKSSILSEESIKTAASTYANEKNNDNSYWLDISDSDNKYFCVTIEELMNKGLLDKKANINSNKYNKYSYVSIKKNKVTFVNSKAEILTDTNSDDYKVCSGNIINEEITTYPKLSNGSSYTDEVHVPFSDVITNPNSNITERICMYGDSTANIKYEGKIEGNTCKLEGLKQNSKYYLRVCMKTERNSYVCSNTESRTTKNVSKPTYTTSSNTLNIEYNISNIIGEAKYYFKSTLNGISNNDVEKCTLDNDIFTCDSSTSTIEGNVWYRSLNKNISITYNTNGTSSVTARTIDKSNNYSESTNSFTIYKRNITFKKGSADKIDDGTSDIVKSCYAINNNKCSITSPSIERKGHTAVGWNTISSSTTSSWNVNTKKDINANMTYYPITKANTYTITYNANGGSGAPASQSYVYKDGGNIYLSSTKPSKTGYTFMGWSLDSGASSASYSAGQWWGTHNANNYTLYAVWKDTTPPTMEWGPSTGTTWCANKVVWVKCSDNGSGMKQTYMDDNGTVTTGTNYTEQGMSTRSGNKRTYFKCTDNAGNVTEKTIWNYYVVNRACSDIYYCRKSEFGCEQYNQKAAAPCSCKTYSYSDWKESYSSTYTTDEKGCKAKNQQGDLSKTICSYKQRTCNCGYWTRTKTCSSYYSCRNSAFGCQTYKQGNCGCNSYNCSY